MPKRRQQDIYGPGVLQAALAGLSAVEISQRLGLKGKTNVAVIGIKHRQIDMLVKDNRDLRICAAIDRGQSDQGIADSFEIHPRLVVALRTELEALDGV